MKSILGLFFTVIAFGVGAAYGQVVFPTQSQIEENQAKAREAIERAMGTLNLQPSGAMPNIDAIPKPQNENPIDLNEIAKQYQTMQNAARAQNARPELLVFVSLSMPQESLRRFSEQASRAGATLVLRGLKENSIKKTAQALQELGLTNAPIAIHPPAFQQFSINKVPAVVLAQGNSGKILGEDGCAPARTFAKVSGDVSLDYALEYIESHDPEWAATAKYYRQKIIKGIN